MKRFLTFIAPAAIVFLSVLSCKPELDNPGIDNPGPEPDLPEIDPGEYSYVLSDNTIILPAECVDLLQYVDLTQKVFNVPASVAGKVSIKPGMNIVINTPTEMFPEGLLANIENVAPDGNGGFNVSYSIAPLLDCFKDINVSESNMDLTGHLQKVLDGNGNEIEFTATKSITSEKFHVVIPQVDIPVATGSTITPKIEADITMKTQLKAEDYTLSTLNLIVDADCSLGADFSIGLSGEIDPRKKVLSLVFGAIPVGPLIITPTVDFYIIVGIGVATKFEASLTYKRSFRAHVHYDEVAGMAVNTKLMDEEPNALEMNIGPKLEASLKYGLGIGPGISFFGGTIGVGLSLDHCLSESISDKIDLMDPEKMKDDYWSWYGLWHFNPTFDLTYELSASANLYGFSSTLSASTPALKFPLKSNPCILQLVGDVEASGDAENVELRTKVAGGSIFYGPVTARLYDDDGDPDTNDYITAEFDFDEEEYAQMSKTDTMEIVATTSLEPGKTYYLKIFTETNGINVLLKSEYMEIKSFDKRLAAAIRAILHEIRSFAVGEWEGCNWDDNYVMAGDYKNVKIGYSNEPGKFNFAITIPNEWELADNVRLTPHTEGLEDILTGWNLYILGEDRYFSKLYIEDPMLSSFNISTDNVDSFSFHCKSSPYRFPYGVQEMDLSGCNFSNLTFDMDRFSKLRKIILNSTTPLYLQLINYSGKSYKMPQIEADGGLSRLKIEYADFSDFDFSKIQNVKTVTLEDCSGSINAQGCKAETMSVNYFEGNISVSECPNLTLLTLDEIKSPSVVVTTNPKLTQFSIYGWDTDVEALSVCDCQSLESLYINSNNLSSLELNNLPSLSLIDCSGSRNLTGVMPHVIDEVLERGGEANYDKRYHYYEWNAIEHKYNKWTDNGYGFYYEGEPERGYHREE